MSRIVSALRNAFMEMFGLSVCPRCEGEGTVPDLTAIELSLDRATGCFNCPLCEGTGFAAYQRTRAWRYGRALQRYRLSTGMSLNQAFYYGGLPPDRIISIENGNVDTSKWPVQLWHLADLQIEREAANHVSTT